MTGDPTVAITGSGALAQRLRARIRRSPLSIGVLEDGRRAGVVVRDRAAPTGAYLDLVTADREGEVFLDDPRALDYVVTMIEHLAITGARTVVVRRPVENEWAAVGSPRRRRSRLRRFRPDDYDWIGSESIDDEIVDAAAVLSADGDELVARFRVLGHFEPLDGRYHWAGTVFGDEVRRWKERRVTAVTVAMDGREPVDARLAEVTPTGAVRIVGVGAPPYALDALQV
ncbi:DUF4873 domain-containing protein [Gordonia sp. HNM0687]|uniref:DUF4873 domain-containing protein n=1 Tax=Gordonia mangrovi TaxID=2665643 RepID=A0A6L7GNL7_9ACTN|nr:DUF4873 domain-containing protein [Gordonia mangrovi]MXP21519.1 DUF4873 domain-containing protein [Gordonia mangrovi]UVF80263.1 DUF4873 domain-containing protein [Gordonia mangrovi]